MRKERKLKEENKERGKKMEGKVSYRDKKER